MGLPDLTVSRFWDELGAEHAQMLNAAGVRNIKRRQALRYFTWRWSWRTLRQSGEQLRFLIRNTSLLDVLDAALGRTDLRASSWRGVSWPVADRWLYAFATRLLWRYALRATHAGGATKLPEPSLGGPLPVRFHGRLISQDLANTAVELAAIEEAVQQAPRSVLEIGAGYGRTAYAVLSLYPGCHYTIVDIEPALTISRWYLTSLFPESRLTFLSPGGIGALAAGSVDLAISISTLSEMTQATRDGYLDLLDRVAEGGRVYLKQWTRWRNPADEIDMRFDEYPIPARWEPVFRRPAPVQTNFTEALWVVGRGSPGGGAPKGQRSRRVQS